MQARFDGPMQARFYNPHCEWLMSLLGPEIWFDIARFMCTPGSLYCRWEALDWEEDWIVQTCNLLQEEFYSGKSSLPAIRDKAALLAQAAKHSRQQPVPNAHASIRSHLLRTTRVAGGCAHIPVMQLRPSQLGDLALDRILEWALEQQDGNSGKTETVKHRLFTDARQNQLSAGLAAQLGWFAHCTSAQGPLPDSKPLSRHFLGDCLEIMIYLILDHTHRVAALVGPGQAALCRHMEVVLILGATLMACAQQKIYRAGLSD